MVGSSTKLNKIMTLQSYIRNSDAFLLPTELHTILECKENYVRNIKNVEGSVIKHMA